MKKDQFFFKLRHWEFWPFSVVYFPVAFYYLWLSIKARSFFFFTAANPGIEFGGMLGESKAAIFNQIPLQYIPITHKFPAGTEVADLKKWMGSNKIEYPIILKPDIGERGWMVRKIGRDEEAMAYLAEIKVSFLAQEYISFPIELGVFYYRFPGEEKGKISSVTKKGLMEVVGDGYSTVVELLSKNPRGRLYVADFERRYPELLTYFPAPGEKVEVEPIGNHCRGTVFINDSAVITEKLENTFDCIADQIPGFFFGRFDIRCSSYAELEAGHNFKILELNGAGAEPGHIYHPGRSIWAGYRDIINHLKVLFNIATENHRRGIPYMHFRPGLRFMKGIRAYNRKKVF